MSAVRDIRNQLKPEVALDPQVIASNTTTVGEIIDTADLDGGLMVSISATVTDGDYTMLLEQSAQANFGGGITVIADENLIGDVDSGQEADAILSASGIKNLGIVNQPERFVRLSVVSANFSSVGAVVAAMYHGKKEVSKISN